MSKPQQYIQGWTEFYKLKFKVTPDVLIPRSETELLVDEVLGYIKNIVIVSGAKQSLNILDLGTGSGNIIISIAKNLGAHLKSVKLVASDISKIALKLAKQNAQLHQVEEKITFIQSDLLSDISNSINFRCHLGDGKLQQFNLQDIDIIVTNLPYIPSGRIPYLDPSVKDFEPYLALDGGQDGFELYRKLFQQISALNVQPRGLPKLIVCEIDYTHGELAILEAQKYFPEADVEVKKDLAKKQRILLIYV